jgi:hypothetical protein
LLSNIIQAIGVNLGEDLIAADENNQAGYFEHSEIVHLHARLLEIIDRRWTGPKGTLKYPDNWWELPPAQPITSRLKEIVHEEIEKADGYWGFKDPRVSRLLPFWNLLFDEIGIEPIYLLSVRDPLAVCSSIQKRDAIDPAQAQLLWLVHNLDSLMDSGVRLKFIIDYDKWFIEPKEQIAVLCNHLAFLEVRAEDIDRAIRLIRPELRHAIEMNTEYLPHVQELHELLKCSRDPILRSDEIQEIYESVHNSMLLLRPWSDIIQTIEVPERRPPPDSRSITTSNDSIVGKIKSRIESMARGY